MLALIVSEKVLVHSNQGETVRSVGGVRSVGRNSKIYIFTITEAAQPRKKNPFAPPDS